MSKKHTGFAMFASFVSSLASGKVSKRASCAGVFILRGVHVAWFVWVMSMDLSRLTRRDAHRTVCGFWFGSFRLGYACVNDGIKRIE